MLSQKEWFDALESRHGAARQAKFRQGRVAICGLGGLGSRVVELLVRAGVGHLRLVDDDRVEATNLNRQLYFMDQLGQYKAEALVASLRRITPYAELVPRILRLTAENIPQELAGYDLIVEAFDGPREKALLCNTVRECFPQAVLVAASGMAGFSSGNRVRVRKLSPHFYLCGDRTADIRDGDGLYGARVNLCAAQEALTVLQLLAGETEKIGKDEYYERK